MNRMNPFVKSLRRLYAAGRIGALRLAALVEAGKLKEKELDYVEHGKETAT